MWKRIARLFQIRTRFEACLVIYALALGAAERGAHYLNEYPGYGGYLLFAACTGAVFMGGGKILDAVRMTRREAPRSPGDRRVADRETSYRRRRTDTAISA